MVVLSSSEYLLTGTSSSFSGILRVLRSEKPRADMVVFTAGKGSGKVTPASRSVFSNKRTVSLGTQSSSRPGTLDARFSRLQRLQQQAQKRQTESRNELLAKRRGMPVDKPAKVRHLSCALSPAELCVYACMYVKSESSGSLWTRALYMPESSRKRCLLYPLVLHQNWKDPAECCPKL